MNNCHECIDDNFLITITYCIMAYHAVVTMFEFHHGNQGLCPCLVDEM